MATPIFCRRLAGSDVNVTPTVMFTDYVGDKITQLMCFPLQQYWFFFTKMNKKHTSTSPYAIQVKNQRKTISTEVKLRRNKPT